MYIFTGINMNKNNSIEIIEIQETTKQKKVKQFNINNITQCFENFAYEKILKISGRR